MSPAISTCDTTYSSWVDAIFLTELYRKFSAIIAFTDLSYSFIRELCASVIRSLRLIVPALCKHILHIVLGISKPQMSGVATWRIVACMKHVNADWNISEADDPRCAVRSIGFIDAPKTTVTFSYSRSEPQPTFIGLSNVHATPETLDSCFGKLDLDARIGDLLHSFIHKFLYVEVRARTAAQTAIALVFYQPIRGGGQS